MLLIAAPVLHGCATAENASTASCEEWTGQIDTDGTRTIVHNLCGSVWQGTAELVEELSIGAETGDPAYLFGSIVDIAATEDTVYVLDGQVPAVRAYSAHDGAYLRDIGREGQGPGEYQNPRLLDVDFDGNVYVQGNRELEVFSATGRPLATWALRPQALDRRPAELTVGRDEIAYVTEALTWDRDRPWVLDLGIAAYEEGQAGAPIRLPEIDFREVYLVGVREWSARAGGRMAMRKPGPPFMPHVVWAVALDGTIVIGAGNEYRFEQYRPDGTVQIVEMYWDPVAVTRAEASWHDADTRDFASRWELVGGWEPDDGIPDHKPAFLQLVAARDGRVWVFRQGPGDLYAGCDPESVLPLWVDAQACWADTYFVDVFDTDGRFLGRVDLPEGLRTQSGSGTFVPRPYIRGDLVLAVVGDELGTEYVKGYRLVLER